MTPRPGDNDPDAPASGQPSSGDPLPPSSAPAATPAVEGVIERFGGIRPMAHKLDIPVTTVQGWKKRGAIPLNRHADLRAAAARHGIALDDAELEAATASEDRAAAAVPGMAADPAVDPAPSGRPTTAAPPDAPPPDAPPRAASPRRSGASAFATATALVALIVGAAALTAPYWRGPAPEPQDTTARAQVRQLQDRLAALDGRVEQLGGRIEEVRSAPAATSEAAATSAELVARVEALTGRLDGLEQRFQTAGANAAAGPEGGQRIDVAGLEGALRTLDERLAGLERRPAPPAPPPDPRIAELAERVAGLSQTADQLGERLARVGESAQTAQTLQREVGTLRQQVGSVEQAAQTQRNRSTQIESLVLASGQLRATLATGQPYPEELRAVRAIGVSDPQVTQALDAIAPHAPNGVPTLALLAGRFETLASDIVRAARRGEGGSWLDQVGGTLATLVTVRRQGAGVVGDSAEAVVARAEAALRDNNLAAAVKEVSALTGPAAEAAKPWLSDAQARLAINEAAQALGTRAIALLAGADEGTGRGAAQ